MTNPLSKTNESPSAPVAVPIAEQSTAFGEGAPAGVAPGGAAPERISRYQITATLGQGAFGRVYRAFDPELKREVAIKVPHAAGLSPGFRERFLREARAAATIHHPNVCPIYDIGTDGAVPYLVMHFVSGSTLADVLARRDGPFAPAEAADVVRRLALGVAAAHARGIVHRDLKPGNVLIDAVTGQVYVTDFGIARLTSEEALTGDGDVLGTPGYMSPEQARGDVGAVGPPSDVYALGVILYRVLTGQMPYRGTVAEVLAQAREALPRPPSVTRPGLDARLDAICLRATAKEPVARFASAADLAAALGAVTGLADPPRPPRSAGETAETVTVVAPATRARRTARRRALFASVGVLLVALVCGLALSGVFRKPSDEAPVAEKVVGVSSNDGPPSVSVVTPSAPEPRFNQAAERRAAEWVLSLRGRVEIVRQGALTSELIADAGSLPPVFRVWRIHFLNDPSVTDEGIRTNLAGLTGPLLIYMVGCTSVTDEGVQALARLPGLEGLGVEGSSGVTDASVQALGGHPGLQHLTLNGTRVTIRGAAALPSVPRLRNLDIGRLPVTDEWLANVVRISALESLQLSGIQNPGRVTAAGLAQLNVLRNFQCLDLTGAAIDGDSLRRLAELPELRQLRLDYAMVGDADLVHLRSFPRLQEVYLAGPRVTDAGMSHLAGCQTLTAAFLAATDVGDVGARALARSRTIKTLTLERTRVTDDGVRALASMPALESIFLFNTSVTDTAAEALATCPNLKQVFFNTPSITDASVIHFAKLKRLEWLVLPGTKLSDASVAELSKMRNLKHLNLIGSAVTSDGFRALEAALPNCALNKLPGG